MQQCSNTGCIPSEVEVAGVVVAAAAAAAAAAAVTAVAITVAAVADLHRKHGAGLKGVGERPPLTTDIDYLSVTSGPSC